MAETSQVAASAGGATERWYALAADDAAKRLGVDPAKGLSAAKAAELLQKNGPNALPAEKPTPGWRRFLGQYRSYMQIILLIAGAASIAIGRVEHGRRTDPADGVQRGGRPSPGGQGRERDERLEIDDEADRARPPRWCRGGAPGRAGRRR